MDNESAFFTTEQPGGASAASVAEEHSGIGGVGGQVPGGSRPHEGFGAMGGQTGGPSGPGSFYVPGGTGGPIGAGRGRSVSQAGESVAGSANFGLARRPGGKRVVGAQRPLVVTDLDGSRAIVKNYIASDAIQFNQVEELQADSISREYAQELLEALFLSWGIPTSDPVVARKAEDVVFAFVAVRGASPYADYDLAVMVGGKEVNLSTLSDILRAREVQRRRFARAVADDVRKYIKLKENAILRDRLQTKLGVFPQYVHLAFDGSTHCTGMNRNEVAFTKALESRNLFDDESVKGSLKGSSLLDGVFQTR